MSFRHDGGIVCAGEVRKVVVEWTPECAARSDEGKCNPIQGKLFLSKKKRGTDGTDALITD
jgi:hypothetical protein